MLRFSHSRAIHPAILTAALALSLSACRLHLKLGSIPGVDAGPEPTCGPGLGGPAQVTISIDGSNGDDTDPCCGTLAAPCQTITHVMELIASSRTNGAILQVSNSDRSTSWTAKETYPIHLGWGVTLSAPFIFFANRTELSEIFQVYAYDAIDRGMVTIRGGDAGVYGLLSDAVYIGFDPMLSDLDAGFYHTKVGVNDAVDGGISLPLVLSEVWMNSNDHQSFESYDLEVGAGAVVTLGPNQVQMGNGNMLGNPNNYSPIWGQHSIYCKGTGAVIQDDATATNPVLTVDSRYSDYVDVEDGCTVRLTQGPRLGGYNTYGCARNCIKDCGIKALAGIVVVGSGNVTFGSAAMPGFIHCAYFGIDQETSNESGSPTVALNGATIDLADVFDCTPNYASCVADPKNGGRGISCAGAMVMEGSFSASSSTFTHAYVGVLAGGNAVSVDLSGGGNGGNTLVCNSRNGAGPFSGCGGNSSVDLHSGADLVNATGNLGINAQNTTWDRWDAIDDATEVWSCRDSSYQDCTCTGPYCSYYPSPGPPPDGADAIYLTANTAVHPIDTSAGRRATTTSCH